MSLPRVKPPNVFLPSAVVDHEVAHSTVAFLEGCLIISIECERDRGLTTLLPPRDGWTREAQARVLVAGELFAPGASGHSDLQVVKVLWAMQGSPAGWIEAREFEARQMLQTPDAGRIIDALWKAIEANGMRGLDRGDAMRLAQETVPA